MLDKGDHFAVRCLVDHIAKGTVFLDSTVTKEVFKPPKGIFGDVVGGSDGLISDPSHRFKVFFVNVFASGGWLEGELDKLCELLRGLVESRETLDDAVIAPFR